MTIRIWNFKKRMHPILVSHPSCTAINNLQDPFTELSPVSDFPTSSINRSPGGRIRDPRFRRRRPPARRLMNFDMSPSGMIDAVPLVISHVRPVPRQPLRRSKVPRLHHARRLRIHPHESAARKEQALVQPPFPSHICSAFHQLIGLWPCQTVTKHNQATVPESAPRVVAKSRELKRKFSGPNVTVSGFVSVQPISVNPSKIVPLSFA